MVTVSSTGAPPASSAPASHLLISLTILAICAGVYFRFAKFDEKLYWHDEAWSSILISGYRLNETRKAITPEGGITASDLQRYQRLDPNRGVVHTLIALAADDAEHTPIYYCSARLWAGVMGDSPARLRAWSAMLSLLTLPLIYWLCIELFASQTTACIGVCLMALSPFQLLYAQEVREYGLWTVTTLLSTAALLRALRVQTHWWWLIYAAATTASLYTMSLTGLLLLAHAAYVIAAFWLRRRDDGPPQQQRRSILNPPQPAKAALLSMVLAVLAFLPWAAVVVIRHHAVRANMSWVSSGLQRTELPARWIGGLSSLFADFSPDLAQSITIDHVLMIVLVITSAYLLYRRTPLKVSALVIAMIVVPVLPLILPDLLLGGRRSAQPRYWVPSYVGMQLAVMGMLGLLVASRVLRQLKWVLFCGLLIMSVVSCVIISNARAWWTKGSRGTLPGTARMISDCAAPLIIGETAGAGMADILSASHYLKPHVRLLLLDRYATVDPPAGFSDYFLFDPNDELVSRYRERGDFELTRLSVKPAFWRIRPRERSSN